MKSRRSVFLINKKFQLRFAFYVCSWLIALSFAYPLIISNVFDYLIRYLALDPMGPELSNLERTRQDLLWLLILMQAVFLSLTFVISIFMSHRIAGPLFKLSRFFREAKEGNLEQKLQFRKSDYFKDIADDYNGMMEGIRGKMADVAKKLEKALPLQTSPEARAELESALASLRKTNKN